MVGNVLAPTAQLHTGGSHHWDPAPTQCATSLRQRENILNSERVRENKQRKPAHKAHCRDWSQMLPHQYNINGRSVDERSPPYRFSSLSESLPIGCGFPSCAATHTHTHSNHHPQTVDLLLLFLLQMVKSVYAECDCFAGGRPVRQILYNYWEPLISSAHQQHTKAPY